MEGMNFPASMTPVVSRPPGLGRVFYVRIWAPGDDGNNGIDPSTPFSTITYALTKCEAGRNDYIIVLDSWNEATPIIVNKSNVHIIGLCNPGLPFVSLTTDGDDDPIFQLSGDDADFVEIAGFDIGGGNSHGGIEPLGVAAADMAFIHHCNFGSEHCGDTALNGVLLGAALGARGWVITDCKFMGTDGVGGGTLIAHGVNIAAGVHHTVQRCLFLNCANPSLQLDGHACFILDNRFVIHAAADGAAITTGVASSLSMIDGNSAMLGGETAMANNPYLEGNPDANNWGENKTTFAGGIANCKLPA